jgi:predicted metalloprotease with PDZ domain
MHVRRFFASAVLLLMWATVAAAQAPVSYRVSFPAPEHRWMQVEATFADVPQGQPLQLRMSRTSPGRYALHEFAKNVFAVSIRDGSGKTLTPTRPDLHEWDVTGHDGTVVVTYRVFGDRTDGTYLSVDVSHAHMNMPASLMWARGFEMRPVRIQFEQPAGRTWRVATQLYPTDDPLTFTAPNFHYLMDSPTEFGAFALRTFSVPNASGPAPTFRIALHHDGTDAEADALARDAEKIVREEMAVFGEFPQYENNTYTFLADYLPWASGDGMEHRNSTVLSSGGALRNPEQRSNLVGTVAHEFFHSWNMERIRSKEIEPFNFEEADVSGELWLGEGFTSYYDGLVTERTGLSTLEATLANWAGVINTVTLSPGRALRSAEDMSRLAPFVDAATAVDRTNWDNTFISYYTFGEAIGLGLDLTLRSRSNAQVTLDTYMRALWAKHGRPGQKVPGMVATPYTMDDLKAVLAEVSGDRGFADAYFSRFIQGHDVVDYGELLARAGFVLRKHGGIPGLSGGSITISNTGGHVASAVQVDSPLYKAGIDRDDVIVSIDGTALTSQDALGLVLRKHKAGDQVPVRFVRRSGESAEGTLTLIADPRVEIVPLERAGETPTDAQKKFRDDWLGSKVKK